ncbi:plasmid mobilization relaxosome protein MobC (plasmid) [Nocardia pseudovaccinii]|uniref:plasmid mobilization relaxosome protein MobC n=1 Tax=Nocardia pseudovaccinii TaxID=189540 RepID=UPI003D8C4E21
MASESPDRRAQARRERQANVAGGRPHRCVVKLSDDEQAALKVLAEAAEMTVPRLLVETVLADSRADVGRSGAVLAVLELDDQVRRIGNNLNQLVRYAHQERELPEHIGAALQAVTRACLSLDATARWVMGKAPAVPLAEDAVVAPPPDLDDDTDSWASMVDG